MIGISEQKKLKHRIGKKTITIFKANGEPLANTKISITQKSHSFLFGCAEFSAVPYANDELGSENKEKSEAVFEKFFQLFNYTTLPFYWETSESNETQTNENRLKRTAEWFKSNNCTIKGHPLCWHGIFPQGMLGLTNNKMLTAQLKRIKHLVSEFAGVIDIWDVINEPIIMPSFIKNNNIISKLCKEVGRINMARETFTTAGKANHNAIFIINDYQLTDSYEILIEGCLEAGIRIDAIGLQSHMFYGYWGTEKILEILERFARFRLPIHFTECTMISGHLIPCERIDPNDYITDDWASTADGEERQAKDAVHFYKILFENSSVESITWWEFIDGNWLGAPSGFITKDNRVKPIYNELLKLIKQDWWTDQNIYITDNMGRVNVSGFFGEYGISYEEKNGKFLLQKDSTNKEERVILS